MNNLNIKDLKPTKRVNYKTVKVGTKYYDHKNESFYQIMEIHKDDKNCILEVDVSPVRHIDRGVVCPKFIMEVHDLEFEIFDDAYRYIIYE